jgi:transglutaminase-like putative cysteine protease
MKYFIYLFIFTTSIWSQKNIDPTAQEISKAKELRLKFDKSDVAILNSNEKIGFKISSDKNNVEVIHNISEKLLNINHRADIYKYEFYDSQSTINTFSLKYKNNKSANFYPKDEFYKSDDLFYNDARVKYFTIDFPVQGYTYLYDFEKKTNDIKYFTTIYFSDEYPVINKEVVITIPKWLDLEIKEFNFDGFDISKTETNSPEAKTYKYVIKNINPTSKDNMQPGPSFIYPHILFVAKSFTIKDEKKTLFSNTADQYKWYKSLIDDMKDDPSAFAEKVKELTKDAKNDDEKIKNIYYWVQDNIRYIAFEDGIAGFKPDDSQNVFNKRYGDCKGMANLTKQMLKSAGFDAHLCWIGTKHIAYDYSIPSLSVDNHMICALFKDGKKYFLDGTEKFNSFGEYAERIQGKQVLIENGEDFILHKIPSHTAAHNKEISRIDYTIDNEKLVGKVNLEYNGESRASFLYQYNNIKNDKKEDAINSFLSSNDKNYKISNITTSDLSNRDEKLMINYDLEINNQVSSFDNEIYIDLDYNKEYKSYDFSKRKEDFEFPFKTNEEIIITVKMPENYTISNLPKNINLETEDYTINFDYKVVQNNLIYTKSFNFKNGVIQSKNFPTWAKHMEVINKSYAEQIVLIKN